MRIRTLLILIAATGAATAFFHAKLKKPLEASGSGATERVRSSVNWLGKAAPDFEIELIDGTSFNLSDHVGREIVVLNFFATWCEPCRTEMPELNRFHLRNHDRPVVLMGVDAAEKRGRVEVFLKETKVEFPVGIDQGDQVQKKYGVKSLPTTVLIGVGGRIEMYETSAISNADVAFSRILDSNLAALWSRQGISREQYLDLAAHETYEKEESVQEDAIPGLTGRAEKIAKAMPCPCGCMKKVLECTCQTAKGIKTKLADGKFEKKTNTQVMEGLNKEFCMKDM